MVRALSVSGTMLSRFWPWRRPVRALDSGIERIDIRQHDAKRRSASQFTRGFDCPAMRRGDPAANAQSQSGPAVRSGFVDLVKTFEDPRESIGGDPNSRVFDRQARSRI